MAEDFYEQPILNSPYEYPGRHWKLGEEGQPVNEIIESRRGSSLYTPIPKAKKKRGRKKKDEDQAELEMGTEGTFSVDGQSYDPTPIINEIRTQVEAWRNLPSPKDWNVTPETARLLTYWRGNHWEGIRPFFCQVEAVETAIWLTEVAPKLGKRTRRILDHLKDANAEANPEIYRTALKLATGAGKTTVMAMLIAWQTINAIRRPTSKHFTRAFLIVAPGITIRDRLRVLQPNDPDSYYQERQLVPQDMLGDLQRAKIIITNYHAFKLRQKMVISKGGKSLLQGRGPELNTLESEGEMVQRVASELMGFKNIVVLNDEAHHCYREKPGDPNEETLKGDDKAEAKKNAEAARLWISGIEVFKRKLGVRVVFDLSATPFFLRGSGYAEGTLFPWTASDFSLMDAIESGIVKLARIPVADNIPGEDVPTFRNLWENIRTEMPKKGRGKSGPLDPLALPLTLQTAMEALYGHYKKTFDLWQENNLRIPPVFIVVCNNTTTSKLVYDYISGFHREDGSYNEGRFELFRNYDEHGQSISRPRTLLIDSHQLESGEALDPKFRKMAAPEIERFKRELRERGKHREAEKIADADLLREVMNTVGSVDRLGESIRCVVSVSMLTEGWDCNTVTHVLGVRAFGTQLLCEQVVGRALRRQSYELNEEGLFNVEYADVLGVPFDFSSKAVLADPVKPRETIRAHAVKPERNHLEIRFPRVTGYRVEPPGTVLRAAFDDDSTLRLSPDIVGPSVTSNAAVIGQSVNLTVDHLDEEVRQSEIIYRLTTHLIYEKYRDPGGDPKLYLFGQLRRLVRHWLKHHLDCVGGCKPGQLLYKAIADMACERIKAAITEAHKDEAPIKAIIDPYNPEGSTAHVNFTTSKDCWETDEKKCHVNWVASDSDWEMEFCRVAEAHPKVLAYVKNQGLGLDVPYLIRSQPKIYRPDFILLIDDDNGPDDLLHLIVEIKGFRNEDVKDKHNTIRAYWIPGVNNHRKYGRWAFAEFTDVYEIESRFSELIAKACEPEEPVPA